MDLSALAPMTVALLLHITRVGAFFAMVPIFGRNSDSRILRLVLALGLGAMTWWTGQMTVDPPASMLAMGVAVVRELVIGLSLGFAFAAINAILSIAGEIISMEMGFSMASTINPETGKGGAVIAQLLQVVGALMVFQLDLHHEALLIARHTFETMPIGKEFDYLPIWAGLNEIVSSAIELAIRLSMPITGVMLILSSGTVLIGRAVPSINMMEFAFGLRILVSLGMIGFFLVEAMPFVAQSFTTLFDRVAEIYGG